MSNITKKGLRKGVAEFRKSLGTLLKGAGLNGERVIVTNHGKDIAALISIEELKRFQALEVMVASQDLKDAEKVSGDDVAGDHEAMFAEEARLDDLSVFEKLPTFDQVDELRQVAVKISQTRMQVEAGLSQLEGQLEAVIAAKVNS